MPCMHIAGLIGLVITVGIVAGQTAPPEKPHLIMWPLSYNVAGSIAPDPTSAIPIVRDDANQPRPVNSNSPQTPASFVSAGAAAHTAYVDLLADATPAQGSSVGWIDKTRMALFLRQVGSDLFVFETPDVYNGQPSPTNPDSDPRTARPPNSNSAWNEWPFPITFFFPKDRLVGLHDTNPGGIGAAFFPFAEADGGPHGHTVRNSSGVITNIYEYYEPGQSNRSYRHPFLVNATAASPLRSYMDEYAQSLKAEFVNSSGPLQHTAQDPVVPTFVFDAEQAHIVQRPDKHNCIYMLWFLTQARVPGASPTSTDENDFIWNRFKVPGSEGWRPGGRGIMVRGSESVQPNPEHGVYWGG
jgi:hypothetical protein